MVIIKNNTYKDECIKENAMLKVNPELYEIWDFKKNNELNVDIYTVTKSSTKIAWWICLKCGSSYDMKICEKVKGSNCPYCRGLRVNETNSLAILRSDIAAQWHPTLNGDLTPNDFTFKSNKKVWWLCPTCKDETFSKINVKMGCRVCSNKKVLKGFNDMWTTNPKQASWLLNPDDGYVHMEQSNKKLKWKCPHCDYLINNRSPNKVYRDGLCCPICSDNISLGEKLITSILNKFECKFIHNKAREWSDKRQYDFYLPDFNMIIETHGIQHYEESGRGRSLKEEQENDRYKRELALRNGIDYYIEIDTRKSDFEYIINNIIKSELVYLLNIKEDDLKTIDFNIDYPIAIQVWDTWNSGIKIVNEVSKILDLDPTTVRKYLKLGNSLNKCDFTSSKTSRKIYSPKIKKVIKLSKDYKYIKTFESQLDAAKSVGKNNSSTVIQACKGEIRYAYDHIWMFEDEYLNYVKNPDAYKLNKNKIVQLDENYNLVNSHMTIREASKATNTLESGIRACCNGIYITSNGFKWMYKEEYLKYLEGDYDVRKPLHFKTPVVQLTVNNGLVKIWDSMTQIKNETGIQHIWDCCAGKRKTAGGFKWVYLDEYRMWNKND